MKNVFVAALVAAAVATTASAQSIVSFTGTYAQNFDSLASTGTSASWSNNPSFPVVQGWSAWRANSAGNTAARDATSNNFTAYGINDGGSNGGNLYSYGSIGSTDRALGSLSSGTPGDILVVLALRNDTGSPISNITLTYDSEQWRNGGNTALHSTVLDYKVVSTIAFSDTEANFTTGYTAPGAAFNTVTNVASSTAAAVDGNVAGLTAGRGGAISLTWNPGQILLLRWWDNNDVGNDHGLAIDNVSIIPTPGAIALMGVGALVATKRRRK
jgi:uncharacterized protein